jgi:hypothetical protein
VKQGTIPGSVNIRWATPNVSRSHRFTLTDVLEKHCQVRAMERLYDCSGVGTPVLFRNGIRMRPITE